MIREIRRHIEDSSESEAAGAWNYAAAQLGVVAVRREYSGWRIITDSANERNTTRLSIRSRFGSSTTAQLLFLPYYPPDSRGSAGAVMTLDEIKMELLNQLAGQSI